jgi:hypothetical protein
MRPEHVTEQTEQVVTPQLGRLPVRPPQSHATRR